MHKKIELLVKNISSVIVGNEAAIEQILITLFSKGHLLIEDAPGLGKTLLARTLSSSIQSRFRRVQCTPDLLPSDITGVSIFNAKSNEFVFKPGPLFANILLVDEINRTTARTQSALLEAMAEKQVSVDGKTYRLPSPFMVIATQNPVEHYGTYLLPEAQLDRFFMKISLGYPTLDSEIAIIKQETQEISALESLTAVLTCEDVLTIQSEINTVFIHDSLLKYIASIVLKTRKHSALSLGASPRGSIALTQASKALAYIKGADSVSPEMIKSLVHPVLAHRLILKEQSSVALILDEILNSVEVPILQ